MWYYVEEGQQRGPVVDADLEALQRDGKINPETLVWRDGMAAWQPLREARPGAAGAAANMPAGDEVVCSQCNGVFPASEVIRYGSQPVCAACKPAFVQKLKEGASVAGGGMEYATFGLRFGAKFLDGLILWVFQTAIGFGVGLIVGAANRSSATLQTSVVFMQIGLIAFGVIFNMLYSAFFLSKYGATPGKMACKIKVIKADGGPLNFSTALLRPLAEIVSSLICYVGYLMMLWDEEKRTLHDRLVNTRVVKK